MYSLKLLKPSSPITTEFFHSGEFSCPRCKEGSRGVECMHDFDSDPKRIWEVIYCSFCGTDLQSIDVTAEYEAKADEQLDAAIDDYRDQKENVLEYYETEDLKNES